ncbi:MAG: phosphoglycolate phosphatase [Rhodospirillaceae bacterium]
MMPKPAAALIFDLDGTLIDSVPDMTRAINRLLTGQGRRALDTAEVREMVGDGATELVRQAWRRTGATLAAAAEAATVDRYIDYYAEHPDSDSAFYPGVAQTLEALAAAGHRLALCTNKPERILRPLLAGLGLAARFEVSLGAGVLARRKPDPAPVRWVLDRLAVAPAQALMIGDSRNDVLSAQAAGVRVVAVSYGYTKVPARDLGAEMVIDRFEQLLDLVRW